MKIPKSKNCRPKKVPRNIAPFSEKPYEWRPEAKI
jgi:hypothetical protein